MPDSSARFVHAVRAARFAALVSSKREKAEEPLPPSPEVRRDDGGALRMHVMVASLAALSALIVIGLLAAMRAPMTVCVDVTWRVGAAAAAGAVTASAMVAAVLAARKD